MLDELQKSTHENLYDKITSPFYGAFIISWLLWNWKIPYTTLFVDGDLLFKKLGILKLDFVINYLTQEMSLFPGDHALFFSFMLPIFSAYLFTFQLPKITRIFFDKSLEFKRQNIQSKLKMEKDLLKEEQKVLDEKATTIDKEINVEKKRTGADKTRNEKWIEEYELFKRNKLFRGFHLIGKSIYEHSGETRGQIIGFKIPTELLAYCHSHGIVDIQGPYHIELTEKGKFFIAQHSNEQ